MKILKCSECKKDFSTRFNLRKHIRKFHSDKADVLAPKKSFNFQCDQCNRNFTHQRHLRYHKKRHEVDPPPVQKNKKCPLCDYWGQQTRQLLCHFTQEHKVDIQTSTQDFPTLEEFKLWKVEVENETKAHFIKSRGTAVIKTQQIVHYGCHRSGIFVSKSKGLRHLKNQGSNKINGFCPAAMKVISKNGACQVTFVETHVGHDNDLNHLWLNPVDKEIIATKISENVPFTEILYEVKNSQSERIQRITRKDLHNIKQTLEQRRARALKTPDEEGFVVDCSNDSSSTEAQKLDAEKEELKTTMEKIIDRISSFEEMGAFKKLIGGMSAALKSQEMKDTPTVLLITRTSSTSRTQVLHYSDHDYAHPVNSVYQIKYEING